MTTVDVTQLTWKPEAVKEGTALMPPALFARTSTGAVQVWQIQVQRDRFRTISGQIDGQKVTSEWTVAKAKNVGRANATTGEQQAMSEAQSKWKKKYDSGYRLTVNEIDDIGFTEPMLAKEWDEHKHKVKFPCFTQPKLDGIRNEAKAGGFWSRNGKPFYVWPSIFDPLKAIWARHSEVIFDGEFYNHDLHDDFDEISSLVKKVKPAAADIEKVARMLQYHIYDLPSSPDDLFSARNLRITQLLNEAGVDYVNGPIRVVETILVSSEEELNAAEERFLAQGYEGQMVRVDAPYQFKRTDLLLKRKRFKDAEFEVVAVTEGKGNKTGWAASMTLRLTDGRTCNSNVKGPEKKLRKMWADRASLIGKMATCRFFCYTPDGMPRFPYVHSIRDYE